MVVGLTGGIGTGKSTVLQIFKTLGVPVYEADVEAKQLMVSNQNIKSKIIDLLGENSYDNKYLNRKFIAQKVFNDQELLKKLNNIVHPEVHKHFKQFIAHQKSPYLVYENAILYENKNDSFCDKVIVVTANLEERIARVIQRDNVEKSDVISRINNQLNEEEKIKKADYLLHNSNIENLEKEVKALHKQLLEIASIKKNLI